MSEVTVSEGDNLKEVESTLTDTSGGNASNSQLECNTLDVAARVPNSLREADENNPNMAVETLNDDEMTIGAEYSIETSNETTATACLIPSADDSSKKQPAEKSDHEDENPKNFSCKAGTEEESVSLWDLCPIGERRSVKQFYFVVAPN